MNIPGTKHRGASILVAGALLWVAGGLLCAACSRPGEPGSPEAPGGPARSGAPASPAGPEVAAADPATAAAEAEIGELFATYLRLHAAKDMAGWQALFLPGAMAVETVPDGSIDAYPVSELAAYIAEAAKRLGTQHETLEEVRIEVAGNAASYSTRYTLYHDGKNVDEGRAFFLLARKDGQWKITALTWYSQ